MKNLFGTLETVEVLVTVVVLVIVRVALFVVVTEVVCVLHAGADPSAKGEKPRAHSNSIKIKFDTRAMLVDRRDTREFGRWAGSASDAELGKTGQRSG